MTLLIPIETLGAEIKARLDRGARYLDKAEEHFIAAGIQLAEAKKRLRETREMTWPAFLLTHCSIRRRRADELIAIADGRTTLAEVRERKARSVQQTRERKASRAALRSAEFVAPRVASLPERPRSPIGSGDLLKAWLEADREERLAFLQKISNDISQWYVPKQWLESAAVALHQARGTKPSQYLRTKYWYAFNEEPPPTEAKLITCAVQ